MWKRQVECKQWGRGKREQVEERRRTLEESRRKEKGKQAGGDVE